MRVSFEARPGRMALAALSLALAVIGAPARSAAPDLAPRSFDLERPRFLTLKDGRRIHFACFGAGSPTVIFESGGEGSILSWSKAAPAISGRTRACVYDRAGMGLSDPPRAPVTAFSVTDELMAVLDRAGVHGPVVLVGHSIGGFYATVFADRFPGRTAGLVLVDPGFAGQTDPRPPESLAVDREHIRAGEAHLLACARMAREGKQGLEATHGCVGYPPPQAPAERAYLAYIVSHPAWYETEYDQSRHFFLGEVDGAPSQDTLQERSVARPFGSLPMIVLSAANPPTRDWNPPEQRRAQAQDLQAGHRALAARSEQGQWRLVEGSGHFIALDKPDAVIAAVNEVVDAARARTRATAPAP